MSLAPPPSAPLRVAYDRAGPCLTIFLEGDLDSELLHPGRVWRTITPGTTWVAIDLSAATSCGRRGVASLVMASARSRVVGARFGLFDPPPEVRYVLESSPLAGEVRTGC